MPRNRRSKLAVLVDASVSTERKQSDARKADAHGILLLPEKCTVLDLVRIACDGDDARLKVAIKKHNSFRRSRSRSRHSFTGLNRASFAQNQHCTVGDIARTSLCSTGSACNALGRSMDSLRSSKGEF